MLSLPSWMGFVRSMGLRMNHSKGYIDSSTLKLRKSKWKEFRVSYRTCVVQYTVY